MSAAKRRTARQAAAQDRKAEVPPADNPNVCPRHRRYVYRGTVCRYCTADYPVIAEDEIILGDGRIAKLSEFDRPNVDNGAHADDLDARLAELGLE